MRLLLKRFGIAVAVALFGLAAVAVVMFAVGKPMAPQVASATTAGAVAAPSGAAADASQGGSDPLAIQIPGCVCHSDDPAVVDEHATYRMSHCFECHQGGVPEMGQ